MLNRTKYFSAPKYVSDEGSVTSKADIWSAGAVLYYLTYGIPPIDSSSQPPPGVRPTRCSLVQDVLNHCLQRNPNQRASHHWLAQHPLTN
jgi:serine/threonine protein kinase